MRVALLSLILCVSFSHGETPENAFKLKRLNGTAQLELTGSFIFTISPDDQWLVFFHRGVEHAPDPPEVHSLYGRLRVMNLRSEEVHSFTLREDQVAMAPFNTAEVSWAADSSMCVLPPPPQIDRRVVIKFAKNQKPTVSFLPHPHQPRKPGEKTPDEQIKLPEHFTCSDCFPHSNDVELLKKHIPKEAQFVGTVTPDQTTHAVSPDGKKIYYQKGPQGKHGTPEGYEETTLYEIDVDTSKERTLIQASGRMPDDRPSSAFA